MHPYFLRLFWAMVFYSYKKKSQIIDIAQKIPQKKYIKNIAELAGASPSYLEKSYFSNTEKDPTQATLTPIVEFYLEEYGYSGWIAFKSKESGFSPEDAHKKSKIKKIDELIAQDSKNVSSNYQKRYTDLLPKTQEKIDGYVIERFDDWVNEIQPPHQPVTGFGAGGAEYQPYTLITQSYFDSVKNSHEQAPDIYNARNFYSKATTDDVQWWGHLNNCVADRAIKSTLLAQIRENKDVAENDTPVLAWIEGSGGMGKSTLLKSLAKDLVLKNYKVGWFNAQRQYLHELEESFKKNDSSLDFLCIDQLDDEKNKQHVYDWLMRCSLKKTKVLIAGRPIQLTDYKVIYKPNDSIIRLDKLDQTQDNETLLAKIAANIDEWNALLSKENQLIKLKPYQILFRLRRASEFDISQHSSWDIIKHDMYLLNIDPENPNKPQVLGFREALGIYACLNVQHNFYFHLSPNIFLQLIAYYREGNKHLPNDIWDIHNILKHYVHIERDMVLFNHDTLAEDIAKFYQPFFEHKQIGVYEWLIEHGDHQTASQTLARYTPTLKNNDPNKFYFDNSTIIKWTDYLLNKGNNNSRYIFSIVNSLVDIDDNTKIQFISLSLQFKNFEDTYSLFHENDYEHYILGIINWLNNKPEEFQREAYITFWQNCGREHWQIFKMYIYYLPDEEKKQELVDTAKTSYDHQIVNHCLDILSEMDFDQQELILIAEQVLSKAGKFNVEYYTNDEYLIYQCFRILSHEDYPNRYFFALFEECRTNNKYSGINSICLAELKSRGYQSEKLIKVAENVLRRLGSPAEIELSTQILLENEYSEQVLIELLNESFESEIKRNHHSYNISAIFEIFLKHNLQRSSWENKINQMIEHKCWGELATLLPTLKQQGIKEELLSHIVQSSIKNGYLNYKILNEATQVCKTENEKLEYLSRLIEDYSANHERKEDLWYFFNYCKSLNIAKTNPNKVCSLAMQIINIQGISTSTFTSCLHFLYKNKYDPNFLIEKAYYAIQNYDYDFDTPLDILIEFQPDSIELAQKLNAIISNTDDQRNYSDYLTAWLKWQDRTIPGKALMQEKVEVLFSFSIDYKSFEKVSWPLNTVTSFTSEEKEHLFDKYLKILLKEAKEQERVLYNHSINSYYLNIGKCYQRIGKDDLALPYLKKANRYNYSYGGEELAKCYYSLKDYNKAIDCYTKLNESQKTNYTYHYLGACYQELNEWDKAIECHLKQVELAPNDPAGWAMLGDCYRSLKQYQTAIEYIDEGFKYNKQSSNLWFKKGQALHELKKYNDAIDCYQNVVRIDPTDHNAWHNIGYEYSFIFKFKRIIPYCEKALQIKPNKIESLLLLYSAYLINGRYIMTISIGIKICSIRPFPLSTKQLILMAIRHITTLPFAIFNIIRSLYKSIFISINILKIWWQKDSKFSESINLQRYRKW